MLFALAGDQVAVPRTPLWFLVSAVGDLCLKPREVGTVGEATEIGRGKDKTALDKLHATTIAHRHTTSTRRAHRHAGLGDHIGRAGLAL